MPYVIGSANIYFDEGSTLKKKEQEKNSLVRNLKMKKKMDRWES